MMGWICESVYCSFAAKKWINRGFLNGPVCPVYGFGALLLILLLSPLKRSVFLLFLASAALTSGLEYLTGFTLETLFHTRYWDYSGRRWNLQGRICLENSLTFGLLGTLAVLYVHPWLLGLILRIPGPVIPFLAGALLCCLLLDTVLTVNAVYSLNGKLDEIQKILDDFRVRAHLAAEETAGALQATLAIRLDDKTRTRLKSLIEGKGRPGMFLRAIQNRILRAFPTMKSLRNNELLQRIKALIEDRARSILHK